MHVHGRPHPPALGILMAAVALVAACSKAPSSAPPTEQPLPLDRTVEGTLLDNSGKPLHGALVVLDPLAGAPSRAGTGPDGRFALGRAFAGKKHTLGVKLGTDEQFVRRDLNQADRHLALDFDVGWGREPVALGTLYAESPRQNDERVARDLGPACTRAWEGKPLELAPEKIPVVLERKEREAWRAHASYEASQLAGVAAICTQTSEKAAGYYKKSKMPAYDVTWQVVMVLRDGRSVRKTFKAPAPLVAMSQLGIAETGQARQLESEVRAWVATSTPRN